MPKVFQARCPICRKPLSLDGEFLICPEKHYSCLAKDFDRLWDEFNAHIERLGQQKASAAYSEKLLKDLQALNVVKRAKAR